MNEPRPPGSPPLVADPRGRPWSTKAAAVVVIVSVAVIALLVMARLEARIDQLEQQIAMSDSGQVHLPVVTTTVAPPMDLPPLDAEVARRAIVGAFTALLGESTSEQRQALLTAPSDLPERLQALAGGPCAGALPIVTDIRFLDDDRAAVRFRFDGPTLPEMAKGFDFDGLAVRVDGRWLIDPAAPLQALDLGASAGVCGA